MHKGGDIISVWYIPPLFFLINGYVVFNADGENCHKNNENYYYLTQTGKLSLHLILILFSISFRV